MIHRGVLHSTAVVRAVVAAESVLAASIPRSLTAATKRAVGGDAGIGHELIVSLSILHPGIGTVPMAVNELGRVRALQMDVVYGCMVAM
jgi:hypothetical protein